MLLQFSPALPGCESHDVTEILPGTRPLQAGTTDFLRVRWQVVPTRRSSVAGFHCLEQRCTLSEVAATWQSWTLDGSCSRAAQARACYGKSQAFYDGKYNRAPTAKSFCTPGRIGSDKMRPSNLVNWQTYESTSLKTTKCHFFVHLVCLHFVLYIQSTKVAQMGALISAKSRDTCHRAA